jgi:hypothetical protein
MKVTVRFGHDVEDVLLVQRPNVGREQIEEFVRQRSSSVSGSPSLALFKKLTNSPTEDLVSPPRIRKRENVLSVSRLDLRQRGVRPELIESDIEFATVVEDIPVMRDVAHHGSHETAPDVVLKNKGGDGALTPGRVFGRPGGRIGRGLSCPGMGKYPDEVVYQERQLGCGRHRASVAMSVDSLATPCQVPGGG